MPHLFDLEGRYGNLLGLQIIERLLQCGNVPGIKGDDDVGIPAKLGRTVQHARLAAHQQEPDPPCSQRRKDFENRVRDQASLPSPGKIPRVSSTRASVPAASSVARRPISLRSGRSCGHLTKHVGLSGAIQKKSHLGTRWDRDNRVAFGLLIQPRATPGGRPGVAGGRSGR